MRKLVLGLLSIFIIGIYANADDCFDATGKAFKDAQTLRKIASDMGWKLGKFKSITAGGFIKSKKVLYPEDNVNVCVKVNGSGNDLIFKVQSEASDAGKAVWRELFAKKR